MAKCNCTNCDCKTCNPDGESWDGIWSCDPECNTGENMDDCCAHKEN